MSNEKLTYLDKEKIKNIAENLPLQERKIFKQIMDKNMLDEAIETADYWDSVNYIKEDGKVELADINIYWTDDENIYEGLSITTYGLKEDEEGTLLIDTNNQLNNFQIEYHNFDFLVSDEIKNQVDEKIEKPEKPEKPEKNNGKKLL